PGSLDPVMIREKYEYIDWEGEISRLETFIESHDDTEDVKESSQALKDLIFIFEAIFGRTSLRTHDNPDQEFIFGWLYRINDDYAACLRQKRPLALIVLSYYTVLLRLMERHWFVIGWSDHILKRTMEIIQDEYVEWLQWPLEQAQKVWDKNKVIVS